MKKLSLAAFIALSMAPLAQADTIFGVYAGAGSWNTDYSGQAGNPSITLKELGVKSQNSNYFYIAIEHPVPLVPNILLERVNASASQSADIKKTFTLDGTNYKVNSHVNSEFDLSHTDATLYYEILDNWVNLDLGVTARQYNGFVSASSIDPVTSANVYKKVKIDQVIPLVYGKAQFDLPFTGLSVGVQGNYISYSGSKLSDFSAKISYLFDSVLDVGVELGYRETKLTVDESDLKGDLDLKGPYAALIAHF